MNVDQPRTLDPDDPPRRRLISVALLPSAATLGNLLCGVFAVLCCLLSIRAEYFALEQKAVHPNLQEIFPSYLAIGAYLIVLAMLFDALDGRLARLTRRTSEFGAQLDSFADIVSFGAAPVVLYLTLLLRLAAPADGSPPLIGDVEWRVGLVSALVYVSCAAIRLARFNVENTKDESTQKKFSGLPVPGAAVGLIALLLLHQELYYGGAEVGSSAWTATARWAFGPFAAALGILMISRLDYVHVFNIYVRREHPPSHLIGLVVLIGLGWYSPPIMLLVGSLAYVISGLVLNRLRRRREADAVVSVEKTHTGMN